MGKQYIEPMFETLIPLSNESDDIDKRDFLELDNTYMELYHWENFIDMLCEKYQLNQPISIELMENGWKEVMVDCKEFIAFGVAAKKQNYAKIQLYRRSVGCLLHELAHIVCYEKYHPYKIGHGFLFINVLNELHQLWFENESELKIKNVDFKLNQPVIGKHINYDTEDIVKIYKKYNKYRKNHLTLKTI